MEVSDFADSLSFPSEPPDIKNWFSSYAYESPELNTYEKCEDSDVRVRDNEEEAVYDFGRGNQEKVVEKKLERRTRNKDNLFSDEVNSNTSTKYTNAAKDCDQTKGLKVLGSLSDSLALSPEPLHVGNWFSSYIYESPVLDTSFDFSCSESQRIEFDGAGRYAEKFCEEKKSNLLQNAEKIFQHGLATCRNSVKDINSQLKCSDKAIDAVAANRPDFITVPNEKRREHILKLKPTEDRNIASTHLRKIDIDCEKFITKVPLNNTTSGKSKKSSGKMADTEKIADLTDESADKENNKNIFSENGFVSTRNNISGVRAGVGSLKRPAEVPLVVNKEYIPKRKSFSEKTNFQHSDGLEITGKWKCPRKNNPKLGPPLKQLRLEQWVTRI